MEQNKSKEKKVNFYERWSFWIITIIALVIIVIWVRRDYDRKEIVDNTKDYNISNTLQTNKSKVKIVDFSKMTKEEAKSWCNKNKIICNILDEYSNTIETGKFVRQDIDTNDMIDEGKTITITYSLGKEPTLGQRNALKKAEAYLRYTSFSYNGLIKQLQYEGFTNEEAIYGVENCKADWNEQAAKMARKYMDYLSFSRSELIKQLKYEGFTDEQVEYGVSFVGY